ncbi:DUF4358 domain-containing protein [uncultured Ruminococcus sp.]|uniref:DUF4358 domain-containing protein n=1 Tax=uncultured Ruminococcus sp. TaxID=165186 RepID=UPI00293142C1|nr:DUF4358 domain-containing protein [uncultured Ruminococcus sp.]
MKKILILLLAVVMVLCCACGKSDAKPLTDVYNDIKAQVGFENVTELNDISLMERYYGITSDMAAEFAGCVNSSGVEQEEIVLVKAVDDASAATVKEKLENRYKAKLDQNKSYNPEQAAMIEKCSVQQNGLYVSMIVSDKAEQITAIYRSEAGLK